MSKDTIIHILALLMALIIGAILFTLVPSVEDYRAEYDNTFYGDVRITRQKTEQPIWLLRYSKLHNDEYLRDISIVGESAINYLSFEACLKYNNLYYVGKDADIYTLSLLIEKCRTGSDLFLD